VAMRFNRHLLIHDKPSNTADIWELVAAERPDLVIVDHIRFCTDIHEKEVKRAGIITSRLRDLSHQFDCAVLALAQLNREYHSRAGTDARPVLTDLRDSGEIEENADNVWMLYVATDGTATKPDLTRVPMELLIRKARDGVRDALVNLVYNRTRQLIRSRSDPEEV
jgi:replicative DNA helicase